MKIIPGKCSFASTTDYGKKIFVVGDNQIKGLRGRDRGSPPEVFLGKDFLKIWSKSTGE